MQKEPKTSADKRPESHVVAAVVKELRTHLGWKQLALAGEAGVTERTIQRLEAGKRMSDETLSKVAMTFPARATWTIFSARTPISWIALTSETTWPTALQA